MAGHGEGEGVVMGRSGEALKSHMSKGYEMARPSGWDPAERLKDQVAVHLFGFVQPA